MEKGQAERLIPMVTEMLTETGITWSDLTLIGVGTGPGNSTGVRISVAAARGLALGLGVPAIGVTRFEAAAFGLLRPLAVIEDARRGEVYVQVMDPDPGAAQVVPIAELAGIVGRLPIAGSAGVLFPATLAGQHLTQPVPLAEAIARIAAGRDRSVALRPAPFYLRGADATPSSDPPLVILS